MFDRPVCSILPGECFFTLDSNLYYTYASRDYLQLIGRERVSRAHGFGTGMSPVDVEPLRLAMLQVLATKTAVVVEDYNLERGLWLEYRIRPAGHGLSILVIDRTAEKLSGYVEKRQEVRWRETAECAAVGMGQLSLDGYWLHANQRGLAILGYSAEDLRDVNLSTMCTSSQNLSDQTELAELARGDRSLVTSERAITRPDGDQAWVRFTFALTVPPAGHAPQISVVFDNIDERKADELSLQFALDSARMGEWDYDATLDITRRSDRFHEIFGVDVPPNEWTFETFVDHIHPDDRDKFSGPFRHALFTGEDVSVEVRLNSGGAAERWLRLSGRVYLNRQGRAVRMAGLVNDVTEAKRAELELQTAKLAADDANREKSYFLANMSHEIRTPLGAILGFTDILRESNLSEVDRNHYLEVLSRNGRSLARLIDDILDLSKVEAGHLDVERTPFAITTLIEDVVSLLRVNAESKGIGLAIDVPTPLPARVTGDPIRLRQILINVLGNAIKFTAHGGVILSTNWDDAPGGRLTFRIKDTGTGVRAEAIDKLFSPFSQADSSTTRLFGGTGLGLALSRRLARAMGGDLILESTAIGAGSTFQLTVPAERTLLTARDPSAKCLPLPAPALKTPPRPGTRVLLAEDSPDNQELIKYMLDRRGINIQVADDGQQAVDLALVDDFDVVLMDMQMPRLDGYEATRRLREAGYRIPIVALTANAMRTDREKCLRAGCSDYVSKPIDANDLYRVMDRLLTEASPEMRMS